MSAGSGVNLAIPLIVPMIACPISFGGTYYMLNNLLNRMKGVAIEVVKCTAEHARSHDDDDDDDDE